MPPITAFEVGYRAAEDPQGLRHGAGALIAFKGEVAIWRKVDAVVAGRWVAMAGLRWYGLVKEPFVAG